MRVLVRVCGRSAYHKSDIGALWGREAFGEGFDGVESVVSAVERVRGCCLLFVASVLV